MNFDDLVKCPMCITNDYNQNNSLPPVFYGKSIPTSLRSVGIFLDGGDLAEKNFDSTLSFYISPNVKSYKKRPVASKLFVKISVKCQNFN